MRAKKAATRTRSRGTLIPVTRGSGNVFADLGLPNPEERLAKAQLAYAIARVIEERGLTQRAAAALMGIDQPKVSHILRGRLADFSTDRLLGFLTGLGGGIIYWNHGAEELYGWKVGEAAGRPIHQLLSTDLPLSEQDFHRQLVENGRWQGEIQQRTKDGQQVVVESRMVTMSEPLPAPERISTWPGTGLGGLGSGSILSLMLSPLRSPPPEGGGSSAKLGVASGMARTAATRSRMGKSTRTASARRARMNRDMGRPPKHRTAAPQTPDGKCSSHEGHPRRPRM